MAYWSLDIKTKLIKKRAKNMLAIVFAIAVPITIMLLIITSTGVASRLFKAKKRKEVTMAVISAFVLVTVILMVCGIGSTVKLFTV